MGVRQPIELAQPLDKHQTFTYRIKSRNTSEDVVIINMEECLKIYLRIDIGNVYLEFDGNASEDSMLMKPGEVYQDDNIMFNDKITAYQSTGNRAVIRGILWGR